MAGMPESPQQVSTSMEVDIKQVRARRRRHWPEAEKRRIVAEALLPGASVALVARRHDLNANQLFAWCRQYREEVVRGEDGSALVPVAVAAASAGDLTSGTIEIAFAGGVRVRVSGAVETATLRAVLSVLSER